MKPFLLCVALAMVWPSLRAVSSPLPAPTQPAHIQTDREIQEAIVKGVLANPEVLAAELHVQVAAGVVTLRGFVRSADARSMAEKVARSAPGVLRVKNRLRVRKPAA